MSIDRLDPKPAQTRAATPRAGQRRRHDRMARITAYCCGTRAPYQAAVVRIGFAAVFAAFLLREWPYRRVLYGDRSPLSWDMALSLIEADRAFSVLGWWDGRLSFEIVYHLTIAAAVAVMVGWRTRTTSALLMIGVLSLENRNSLVGDGGDNVLRIMVIYLLFTRCAEVWSLDARRVRSRAGDSVRDPSGVVLWSLSGLLLFWAFGPQVTGWPLVFWTLWLVHGVWWSVNRWFPRHEVREVLNSCAAMVHNSAMLVIAVQVCLIYATAGWYKIQGSRWQEGSALYYVLNLDYFTPWTSLAGFVAANTVMVLLLSYGTVMVQVAFPFTLGHRKIKNVLLVLMIGEHVAIAVLLGIPFLSLAMVVCDAVFLPTLFLTRLGTGLSGLAGRCRGRALGLVRT